MVGAVGGTLAGFTLFHIQPHIFCRGTLFAIEAGAFFSLPHLGETGV